MHAYVDDGVYKKIAKCTGFWLHLPSVSFHFNFPKSFNYRQTPSHLGQRVHLCTHVGAWRKELYFDNTDKGVKAVYNCCKDRIPAYPCGNSTAVEGTIQRQRAFASISLPLASYFKILITWMWQFDWTVHSDTSVVSCP